MPERLAALLDRPPQLLNATDSPALGVLCIGRATPPTRHMVAACQQNPHPTLPKHTPPPRSIQHPPSQPAHTHTPHRTTPVRNHQTTWGYPK